MMQQRKLATFTTRFYSDISHKNQGMAILLCAAIKYLEKNRNFKYLGYFRTLVICSARKDRVKHKIMYVF